MVNVTINGIPVSVPEGSTILDATRAAGCPVPTLCFLKDINEIAACRVCVVELEGADHLITACNNVCAEGMVIRTNSSKHRADPQPAPAQLSRLQPVKVLPAEKGGQLHQYGRPHEFPA